MGARDTHPATGAPSLRPPGHFRGVNAEQFLHMTTLKKLHFEARIVPSAGPRLKLTGWRRGREKRGHFSAPSETQQRSEGGAGALGQSGTCWENENAPGVR